MFGILNSWFVVSCVAYHSYTLLLCNIKWTFDALQFRSIWCCISWYWKSLLSWVLNTIMNYRICTRRYWKLPPKAFLKKTLHLCATRTACKTGDKTFKGKHLNLVKILVVKWAKKCQCHFDNLEVILADKSCIIGSLNRHQTRSTNSSSGQVVRVPRGTHLHFWSPRVQGHARTAFDHTRGTYYRDIVATRPHRYLSSLPRVERCNDPSILGRGFEPKWRCILARLRSTMGKPCLVGHARRARKVA